MRVRSTGLGNQEMVASISGLKLIEGYLCMNVESSEPVKWRIRIVMTHKDILRLVKVGTFKILLYLITGLKTIFTTPPPPKSY